jgi:hypothetical protein
MAAATDAPIANALRFLTLRHAQSVQNARLGLQNPPKSAAEVDEGHQKLHSYFLPSLDGGDHEVKVVQNIEAEGNASLKDKTSLKIFRVEAPQYRLPDGCVHSVNPAEGERAPAEALPHLVFGDPHMPWERKLNNIPDDKSRRERVPWIALLVFGPDEVRVASDDLAGSDSIFATTKLAQNAALAGRPVQQSPTFTLDISYSDIELIKKKGVASPIPPPEVGKEATTSMEVICIRPTLFNKLITTYENGSPKNGQTVADVSRYKYLAHVRQVRTDGMAASAKYDKGLFSVVLSHRLGPLDMERQSPAVAHLVSIEGWESMSLLDPGKVKYVALTSLYSWSYTAMPTNGFELDAVFANVGRNVDVLRIPEERIRGMADRKNRTNVELLRRLFHGYTMTRYRTPTGEETPALIRGVLVPTIPDHPVTQTWAAMSNCGTDLQILDQGTGILDITYSTAWNLGKALALADPAFTTSLSRLRNRILAWALNDAKRRALAERKAFKSREEVITSLAKALQALNGLSKEAPEDNSEARWRTNFDSSETVDLTTDNPKIKEILKESAKDQARRLAGSTVRDEDGKVVDVGQSLFNELNTPFSTDWMTVISWIVDRMYLFGVPSHHLVADPSFLPRESIRFFHVDPNWIDCLIDGALSLANQVSQTDDFIRRALKGAINAYIGTVSPDTGYRPQIPSHGFLIRSDLIKQYPDLKVEAPIPSDGDDPETQRAPILRHEIIGDGILLCLLDRSPSSKQMPQLSFTQPPHQQTFGVGNSITPTELEMTWKRSYYSDNSQRGKKETFRKGEAKPTQDPCPFLWGENSEDRFLLLDTWAGNLLRNIQAGRMDDFKDDKVTSALVGFQLGTPIYRLTIGVDEELSNRLASLATAQTARLLKLLDGRELQEASPWHSSRMAITNMAPLAQMAAPSRPLALPLLQDTAHRSMLARAADFSGQAEISDTPTFRYAVYPSDGKRTAVLTTTGHPQDLVFSIVRNRGQAAAMQDGSYDLVQIVLRVPCGKMAGENQAATLLDTYDGPGAIMLSNLRFNVLVESGDEFLQLRLVPRSQSRKVAIGRVPECSFSLNMVEVHPYTDLRHVTVRGEEHYLLRHHETKSRLSIKPFRVALEPS